MWHKQTASPASGRLFFAFSNWLITQDGDHLVVLDHFQRSRHDEAERVDGFARVVQQIARCRMGHGEMHCQGSKAAVAGQPEGRMLVEHLSIEVNANIRLHVLGAVVEDLDGQSISTW